MEEKKRTNLLALDAFSMAGIQELTPLKVLVGVLGRAQKGPWEELVLVHHWLEGRIPALRVFGSSFLPH